MQTKIFLGTLLFMVIFAAAGLVLINEGVLPDQRTQRYRPHASGDARTARAIDRGRSFDLF